MKSLLSFLTERYNYNIRTKGLLFLVFISLWTTHSFPFETFLTDCGLPECKVKFRSRHDVYIGCEAIKRATYFFKINGYEIKTPIDIEFVGNARNKIKKGRGHKPSIDQFLCQYNTKTKCIKISSWISCANWNRKAFAVFPMEIEFLTSMVTHEVAHRLFDSILESRAEITSQSFHEFIAYIAQIETMKEPYKSKVLSLWPKEKLPSVFAINSFVWMAEPNKFSILSYNFFKSNPVVFQRILNGKIKPIEMEFILDY
ncbi:hypothetical protein [Desulfobacula sp.]|uniref:hypothetical protein n=1 Tax=Desulfobacula sp. TaxID=2593537 RepID=UPI00260C0EC9|nr:hypothetical protein [Desulfobacula sp.]